VKVKFATKVSYQQKCELHISISDTGIGIAEDEYDTIFEAFKQSRFLGDKAYSGTGLGLSISKQLVENMGGKILLKSELNVGTTFTIIIPDLEFIDKGNSSEIPGKLSTPFLQTSEYATEIQDENPFDYLTISEAVRVKIISKFGLQWEHLNKSHLVPELSLFAQDLKQFSESENIPPLIYSSTELLAACRRFDVDKIESIMSGLKNIFVK